jgi:HlyD family secretion protein
VKFIATLMRSNVPPVYWLIPTILLTLSVSGCASKAGKAEVAANEEKSTDETALSVRAEAVQLRTIEQTVEGIGRCETLPDRVASLTPAVEGRIQRMVLKLGDAVQRGQAIVELDTRLAKANLAEKTASRDGLQASLELLKAPPRAEELKSQELAVAAAALAFDKANATAERLRPLLSKEQIPQAQMYEADMAISLAKLQRESADAQLAAMKLGPRPEAIAEAQAKITTAEALVDSAQAQLDLHTLTVPIDGILDSLSCQLGQTIAPGTPIGEVVDTRQLIIALWIPAREASRVALGQIVHVQPTQTSRTPGSEELESEALEGAVTFIGRAVDLQTGNLPVQILIDNSTGRFAAGQMVSVSITVGAKKNVLAVPASALFDVGEGPAICVVRDGKSVRAVPELGVRDRQWVQVLGSDLKESLSPNDQIITEGGYNLPDGTAVKVESESTGESQKAEPRAAPGEQP